MIRQLSSKFNLTSLLTLFLIFILCWLSFQNPPRNHLVFSYFAGNANKVSFNGVTWPILTFLIFNYFLTALFGLSLSLPFFKEIPESSLLTKVFACFFIGYVCLLGVIRVVSFFFSYEHIYVPVVFIEAIVISFYLLIPFYKNLNVQKFLSQITPKSIFFFFLQFSLILSFIFIILIHQIRMGEFSWVGHGPDQYSYLLDLWRSQMAAHFPLITKHYDELIFHYFLTVSFSPTLMAIIPWWITLAVTKASLISFLYLIFRKIGVSFFLSLLFSLFLFLGTTSLVPMRYYILFDSSNPLFYVVHSGRLVGVGFILLYILYILYDYPQKNYLPYIFFLLSAVGLTVTSYSNVLWILYLLPFLMLFHCYKNLPSNLKIPKFFSVPSLLCFMSVFSCLLMYSLSFKEPFHFTVRLLLLTVNALLFFLYFSPKFFYLFTSNFKIKKESPLFKQGILLLVGIALGTLLLGNLFVDNPLTRNMLKVGKPILGTIDIQTLPEWKGKEAIQELKSFKIGDYREIGEWNRYSENLVFFCAYYGGILTLILLVNWLFRSISQSKKLERIDYAFFDTFLACVGLLPFIFFFIDCVEFGGRAWLKSRFLEIPVYIIIITLFYYCHQIKSSLKKILICVLILVYIITPIYSSRRITQWKHNWGIFLDLCQK